MSTHDGFVKVVEAIFEKEYSPEGLRVLDRNLPQFPRDVLIQVTKELENGDLKWRPKPKELVDHCAVVNRRMHPVNTGPKAPEQKSTDDLQRRMGSVIVGMMLAGKASWQQIFDKIREADKNRPNSGWDKCGMTIERHHEKHGTDLSKPPQNIISTSI